MRKLKRNFVKSKMNKDLDDRFLPPGEYRDALNISVITNQNSSSGAIQNSKGNEQVSDTSGTLPKECIGAVSDESTNSVYYFASTHDDDTSRIQNWSTLSGTGGTELITDPTMSYNSQSNHPFWDNGQNAGTHNWMNNTGFLKVFSAGSSQSHYLWSNSITLQDGHTYKLEYDITAVSNGAGQPASRLFIASGGGTNAGSYRPAQDYDLTVGTGQSITFTFDKSQNGNSNNVNINWWLYKTSSNNVTKTISVDNVKLSDQTELNSVYQDIIYEYKDNKTALVCNDIYMLEVPYASAALNIASKTFTSEILSEEYYWRIVDEDLEPIADSGCRGIVTSYNTSTNVATLETEDGGAIDWPGSNSTNYRMVFTKPKILELTTQSKMSAINIVDGMLFWTDGYNEPKKINIENCKLGTSNFLTPTYLHLDGFDDVNDGLTDSIVRLSKEHVTVIRKAPTAPPIIQKITTTSLSGLTNSVTFTADLDALGSGGGMGLQVIVPGDSITVTTNENSSTTSLQSGDTLQILQGGPDVDNFTIPDITATIDSFSGTSLTLRITYVNEDVDYSNSEPYNCQKGETMTLYREKFVKFALRYKYIDGEHSSLSPFSTVCFQPEDYVWDSNSGSNLGMLNKVKHLGMWGFVRSDIPKDVVAIDILYKQSNSPSIFNFKTVVRDSSAWNEVGLGYSGRGHRGYLTFSAEELHGMLPSSQLLRSWDAVPRSAVAQEVVGNRLVYGNYKQNYDLKSGGVDIDFQITANSYAGRYNSYSKEGLLSCKSLRRYQVGVVYGDVYGRETAVLTSEGGSVDIPESITNGRNLLEAQINSTPPPWADYYRYYVKESSSEYYNFALDRWYDAGDNNIWLVFHSADRNKVTEDSILYLKKKHGKNEGVGGNVSVKVLSIENEAPDITKTTYKILTAYSGQDENVRNGLSTTGTYNSARYGFVETPVYVDAAASTPVQQSPPLVPFKGNINPGDTFIDIDHLAWEDSDLAGLENDWWNQGYGGQLVMKVHRVGTYSEEYVVSNIQTPSNSTTAATYDRYRITLDKPLGSDVSFVKINAHHATVPFQMNTHVDLVFYNKIIAPKPEHIGKFFVKVQKTPEIQNYVMTDGKNIETRDFMELAVPYLAHNAIYYSDGSTGISTTHANVTAGSNKAGGIEGATHTTYAADDGSAEWHYRIEGRTANFTNTGVNARTETEWQDYCNRHSLNNATDEFIAIFKEPYTQLKQWYYQNGPNWTPLYKASDGTVDASSGGSWTNTGSAVVPAIGNNWTDNNPARFVNGTDDADGYKTSIPVYMDTLYAQQGGGWDGHIWSQYDGAEPNNFPETSVVRNGAGADKGSTAMGFVYVAGTNEYSDDKLWTFWNRLTVNAKYGTFQKFYFKDDPDKIIYTVNNAYWHRALKLHTASGSNPTNPGCNDAKISRIVLDKPLGQGPSGWSPVYHSSVNAGSANYPATIDTGIGYSDPSNTQLTTTIVLIDEQFDNDDTFTVDSPAVFETKPIIEEGVDIYYEAGPAIPIKLKTQEQLSISAYGKYLPSETEKIAVKGSAIEVDYSGNGGGTFQSTVESVNTNGIIVCEDTEGTAGDIVNGDIGRVYFRYDHKDMGYISFKVEAHSSTGAPPKMYLTPKHTIHGRPNGISYGNCFSFGNGVESDRIRDDFNTVVMGKGDIASTTLPSVEKENHHKYGLIYSGIYNSKTGLNDLNQFIAAENITKDLNPDYGSIQKLNTRESDMTVLCEDKILKLLINKNSLYNADASTNISASNIVLGQEVPYVGEYGIAKNPESFSQHGYKSYFTDRSRGAVLRLSKDGLTTISKNGLETYFDENIRGKDFIIGTYDAKKYEYNITYKKPGPTAISKSISNNNKTITFEKPPINYTWKVGMEIEGDGLVRGTTISSITTDTQIIVSNAMIGTFEAGQEYNAFEKETISFNDISNGWVSFRSFLPENGLSVRGEYFTYRDGDMYQHYLNDTANEYYGVSYNSNITTIFNDAAEIVKDFKILSYLGSKPKTFASTNNNQTVDYGWYVKDIQTDLEEGYVGKFEKKEGKFFGYIKGKYLTTNASGNTQRKLLGTAEEFTTQGLGNVVDFNSQPGWYNSVNLTFSNIVHESAHNANDGGFDVSVTGIPADRGVRLYDSNNNIISTMLENDSAGTHSETFTNLAPETYDLVVFNESNGTEDVQITSPTAIVNPYLAFNFVDFAGNTGFTFTEPTTYQGTDGEIAFTIKSYGQSGSKSWRLQRNDGNNWNTIQEDAYSFGDGTTETLSVVIKNTNSTINGVIVNAIDEPTLMGGTYRLHSKLGGQLHQVGNSFDTISAAMPFGSGVTGVYHISTLTAIQETAFQTHDCELRFDLFNFSFQSGVNNTDVSWKIFDQTNNVVHDGTQLNQSNFGSWVNIPYWIRKGDGSFGSSGNTTSGLSIPGGIFGGQVYRVQAYIRDANGAWVAKANDYREVTTLAFNTSPPTSMLSVYQITNETVGGLNDGRIEFFIHQDPDDTGYTTGIGFKIFRDIDLVTPIIDCSTGAAINNVTWPLDANASTDEQVTVSISGDSLLAYFEKGWQAGQQVSAPNQVYGLNGDTYRIQATYQGNDITGEFIDVTVSIDTAQTHDNIN